MIQEPNGLVKSLLRDGEDMDEKRNDVRTNLKYILFKIYVFCKHNYHQPHDWVHENYILSWNDDHLLLKGSQYQIEVKSEKVYLDERISEYYQVPYSWLQTITKSAL